MTEEQKSQAVRVAVEIALFWQLRETGGDFTSSQDLLATVWTLLEKMTILNLPSAIDFSESYNQNREIELSLQTPAARHPILPQAGGQQTDGQAALSPSSAQIGPTQNPAAMQAILLETSLFRGQQARPSLPRENAIAITYRPSQTSLFPTFQETLPPVSTFFQPRMPQTAQIIPWDCPQFSRAAPTPLRNPPQDSQTAQSASSDRPQVSRPAETASTDRLQLSPAAETPTRDGSQPLHSPSLRDGAVALNHQPIRKPSPQRNFTVTALMNNEVICKVCLDAPATGVLIPCGHVCACDSCYPQINICPICRAQIKGRVHPMFH